MGYKVGEERLPTPDQSYRETFIHLIRSYVVDNNPASLQMRESEFDTLKHPVSLARTPVRLFKNEGGWSDLKGKF